MTRSFSKNLKYLRQKHNVSQQDLATKLNVDRSSISRWENDEMDITMGNAIQISNFFNIPVEDFTNRDLENESANNIQLSQREILFNKTKDILSDSDWATIEFIMKKTIDEYEKNKNGG